MVNPRGPLHKNCNRDAVATKVCCGFPVVALPKIDDVAFAKKMIAKVRDEIMAASGVTLEEVEDPGEQRPLHRIFSFGFSTGGLFSYRLACDAPELITGVGIVGATFDRAFSDYLGPGTMAWARTCKNGNGVKARVWSGIGTQDTFTTADQAAAGWSLLPQPTQCQHC